MLWHGDAVRPALLLLLAFGCNASAPPCQPWQIDKAAFEPLIRLSDEAPSGALTLQVIIPSGARYAGGTPVAVYVHGGWNTDTVPLAPGGPRLRSDQGFATIYLNLPGGDSEDASEGANDLRGDGARHALGAALRYAAGGVVDTDFCTLDDRLPDGLSGEIILAGWSNGGNLAWATAADPEVELPQIDGIATFETPASGQLITVEPGTEDHPGDYFDARTCLLSEDHRLSCPHGYPGLAWDPDAETEMDTDGTLFIDENANGELDLRESTLDPIWSPADDAWVHPLEALDAADHIDLTRRADVPAATVFWAARTAPVHMAGVAARFPELAGIATGTEIDHVLTDLELPIHVTGMVAAMQSAGMPWVRLHPDSVYVAQLTGREDAADISANITIDVVDPLLSMEPEDDETIRGTDYLSAAVMELMDRAHHDRWGTDLEAPIVKHP